MKSLEGNYNFKESEKKWQEYWKKNNTYSWNKNEPRENSYVVDTPPPTVSGTLHMGHIFSYTQADLIVRFQRMKGKNVFYPMGFDDNGLPTERLVEKQKNIKASQTDRNEFAKICESVINEEEEKFESLFTSMGLSVDWDLKYQSISKTSCKISQMSFLDLAEKDEIYRKEQPVLWDPADQTALAQADIEDKEKNSEMHDIAFKDEAGNDLIIATTRPELLPACVAMFYNPEDKKYAHLKGTYAISPLFNVKVPILPDPHVNPEKGTGLVMCCTFGDTTDIEWWRTHKLPLKIILDKTGRIKPGISFESKESQDVYSLLIGLTVNVARAKILEILREKNLVLKSVPVAQVVKCAERSGAPLEIITEPQWFVRTIKHKDALLQKSAELNWHPKSMKIKLDNWINGVSWDWCISRQRFFGVPFPVWYSKRAGEEGKIIFAKFSQLPIDPIKDLPDGYSREEVVGDMDVMDTWATSAVSPQLSSHAINDKYNIDLDRHKNLFPFDLRPSAHEILRTWAFYTILKSHLHEGTLPWKNIMISGWCLADDKTKMSKSKGNFIPPITLIENYGADVIRYWTSTSRLGADTAFSEDLLKIGKKLVNKIWNAAKFASGHFSRIDLTVMPDLIQHPENDKTRFRIEPKMVGGMTQYLSLEQLIDEKLINNDVDLWIISKLQKTSSKALEAFESYEFAIAREYVEEFFWKDFCDNYLEISKARCYNEDGSNPEGQTSAIHTLYHTLKIILQLFAPYLPHITEEIYQTIYEENSIHSRNNWPTIDSNLENSVAENVGDTTVNILDLVRKAKASKNLSMKTEIKNLYVFSVVKLSEKAALDLKNVTNSLNIEFTDKKPEGEIFEDDFGNWIGVEV